MTVTDSTPSDDPPVSAVREKAGRERPWHIAGTRAPYERGLIDGQWTTGASTSSFDVIDPATSVTVATLPRMTADDACRAVEGARQAYAGWRHAGASVRARVLRRWADIMLARRDALATIITAEQGKPLSESYAEIDYAASFVEWFAEEARRTYGETVPSHTSATRIAVLREPLGVGIAITPWNLPAAMVTRTVAPAIATGNTVVLKPAEQTPLTALALADFALEAGLPSGVLQVVVGAADDAPLLGAAMIEHPVTRKLSFTGSTAVGKLLMAQCAAGLTRVSLELGGNAPFIVFDDADLDVALEAVRVAKFRNAGQTCISANRIFVQDAVFDAFTERLTELARSLRVGNGFAEGTDMGPLVDMAAVDKVRRHVDDAVERGAEMVYGGPVPGHESLFYAPTVLTGATSDMLLGHEETFGPVAALQRFDSEKQIIAVANATASGLAAYFFTRDVNRSWRVTEGLEYGIVGHNTGAISTAVAPFGGMKESGIGRAGSRHATEEWTELKYVCTGVL